MIGAVSLWERKCNTYATRELQVAQRLYRQPTNEDTIIAVVEWEPCRISPEFGLSQSRVLEVLCDQLNPYHCSRSAHPFPDYYLLRTQFCEWLQYQHTGDELILHNILWADEACLRECCGTLLSHLKWMEAASDTCCNYEMPVVWLFYSLCCSTVTCIFKTIHHRTYIGQYFQLVSYRGITLWRAHT
jgi:hypothetical protein